MQRPLDLISKACMNLEIIIKIVGAIVAISSAGKIAYDITTGKKSRLREDYKFG
jgi:hypothetical protein